MGTAGTGGGNTAGSVAPPQDGGIGGAVDAARDGNRDGVNDVRAGGNDAGAIDSPFDASKNPDGMGDAARDRIPTADTRDGATLPKDTGSDGSTPCGECLLGLTCGGGGVANQCGITVAPQEWRNCSIAGWCSEADRPTGLNAIYARYPDDIWAVGRSGRIAHFDGTAWTITSGVIQASTFASYPDTAANNAQFTSVWVSGPSDIWVIATGTVAAKTESGSASTSFVLRGDGTHWNVVLPPTSPLTTHAGIWGTGPDDVWVAQYTYRSSTTSYLPSVSHWNGTDWTVLSPPLATGITYGVWGLSANDVYLLGQNNLWHFDGATWTSIPQSGQAMWGTSATSLWVVKDKQLFHSVGATWVQMKPPTGCGSGIWGTSDSSLWFGGCYYDGLTWTSVYSPGLGVVQGPTAAGALGLAGDGSIVSLTPTSATALSADVPAITSHDVSGSGPADVWIVGANVGSNGKARALHWDGIAFKVIDQTSPAAFTTVSVLPDNDVWAGASSGLWRLSGDSLVASTGSPKGTRQQLWSSAKDAIWAVTGSDASISFFDGAAWKALPHGLSSSTVKLASVWGSAATDIWVAGSGGITEHWNGTTWTAYDAGTADLVRVWGASSTEVFVAAKDNKIYTWDVSRWTLSSTATLPSNAGFVDYRACAANEVWASLKSTYYSLSYGTNTAYSVPELGHFDGNAWHVYSVGELELVNVARIWCAAPGDVWVVSGGTTIRHLRTP